MCSSDLNDFKRLGILHLLDTSVHFTDNLNEATRGPCKQYKYGAFVVESTDADRLVTKVSLSNPEAVCHVVPQPYEDAVVYWIDFIGHLCDEARDITQIFIQQGFYKFWLDVEITRSIQNFNMVKRLSNMTEVATGAKSISLEFEIMLIFPICCVILVLAMGILIVEINAHRFFGL